jgi:hypothetical protein
MSAAELSELRARREACEGESKLPVARALVQDRTSAATSRSVAHATTVADPTGSSPDNTGTLLHGVERFMGRFVVLPSKAAGAALSLFVLHTYAFEAAEQTPYLLLTSPERRSGKTRLLEVLELLVRKPWRVAGASESALFRKLEQDTPTLLLDEIDAIFGRNTEQTEPLRAVLNAGNRRGACVARVVGKGKEMQVADFGVYSPKVLAGITSNRLSDTLTDRSVGIQMRRRRDDESVERFHLRDVEPVAATLREALEGWAQNALPALEAARPELPSELTDRQADAWEPLFAVADMTGGEWPARARRAAHELAPTDADDAGYGTQLLAALRAAMTGDHVPTAELLNTINEDDELPFGGWRDGRGLDARTLARMLKPYGVRPKTLSIGDTRPKGYALLDCQDAFSRYLSGAQLALPAQPDQPDTADVADVAQVAALPVSNGHKPGNALTADVFDDEDQYWREVEAANTQPIAAVEGEQAPLCACESPIVDQDENDGRQGCCRCGRWI